MAKQALDGIRINAFLMEPQALQIVTDKTHPLYDARAEMPLDEALVQNVMARGILQPVCVTKDGDQVLVVYGRQRVRAALEANKRLAAMNKQTLRVPCTYRRGDQKSLFLDTISENEHRIDDPAMEKAEKAQRILNLGVTEDEVANSFGWTAATLKNHLKLLELCAAVRKAVNSELITPTAASQLHGMSVEDQTAALDKLLAGGCKPTVRNARKVAAEQSPEKVSCVSKLDMRLLAESPGTPENFRLFLQWLLGVADNDVVAKKLPWIFDAPEKDNAADVTESKK